MKKHTLRFKVFGLSAGIFAFVLLASGCGPKRESPASVRVGSKNFTEQFILGELMAQLLESRTDLKVEREFNLGGTMICHGALTKGEIDLYAEYTGTGLTAVLHREVIASPTAAYDAVAETYRTQFACEWLRPFGFNNTYAITVREDEARARGWRTISDVVPVAGELKAGFTAEFMERPDGYPGLSKSYGFKFGTVRDLDPGLMYRAVVAREVDVICAFATDGRIAAYNLQPLTDDKEFFPPYYAAPVARQAVLSKHPEIREVLDLLAARIDDATMQRLNYEVDEKKRTARAVGKEFLEGEGFLSGKERQ